MTRDEARAIAIGVVARMRSGNRPVADAIKDAAEIETWLMRPAISDEDAQAIRDAGPGSILGGEEIDLSGVAGMGEQPSRLDRAAARTLKSCTCPSCTAARAWRAADGHPADRPKTDTEERNRYETLREQTWKAWSGYGNSNRVKGSNYEQCFDAGYDNGWLHAKSEAPTAIRTESMRRARDIIGSLFVEAWNRGSPLISATLSTEETDKAIMAILRAINE